MSAHPGATSTDHCRKRKQPTSLLPESSSTDGALPNLRTSDCLEDFPTSFAFESTRHVRCRLSTPSTDLGDPYSPVSTQPRAKRKTRLSSRQLDMVPCSPSGQEPPICDTVLDAWMHRLILPQTSLRVSASNLPAVCEGAWHLTRLIKMHRYLLPFQCLRMSTNICLTHMVQLLLAVYQLESKVTIPLACCLPHMAVILLTGR